MEPWAIAVMVAGIVLGLILLLVLLKLYFRGGQFRERVRLDGKVAVVTGANVGLGKETVRQLARRGAHVLMLCRSEAKAKEAIEDLARGKKRFQRGCSPSQLTFVRCDLSDFDSVRRCAEEIKQSIEEILKKRL